MNFATMLLAGAVIFVISRLFGDSPAATAPGTIPTTAPVSPRWDKYRQTRHGSNPWTREGLQNVIRLHKFVDTAVDVSGGKLTSGFRSARVQKLVHQARGYPPAPKDPHTIGKAYDIMPVSTNIDAMYARLLHAKKVGDLGPVKSIARAKTRDHIHIVWN